MSALLRPIRLHRIRAAATALLLLFTAGISAHAADPATRWPQDAGDIRADAAVTWGALPNGLRYAIMPNTEPPGRISLRLCVRTGSLMETESQRGLSHFLEHMAFNGTKHFAADELIGRFQNQGLGFGSDINAHTGMYETVYILELPRTDAPLVGDCLQLLRDYADGQLLKAEEIEKERGVILSEKRDRDSVGYRTTLAQMSFLFPGSLLARRSPIGEEDVIAKAPRAEFASLYQSGHVPGRMLVVAVGAVDAKTFSPLIEKYFADIQAPAAPKADPDLSWKPAAGPHAMLHHEDEAPATSLSISSVQPFTVQPDTLAARRALLYRAISCMIVSRRLEILAKKDGAGFVPRGVEGQDLYRAATIAEISAECQPEQWKTTLGVLEQELRRALSYGFTKPEIAELSAQVRSSAEQAVKSAATRKSRQLADGIYRAILNEEVFTSPQADFEQVKADLDALTPEALLAEFRKLWAADAAGIFAAGNLKLDNAPAALLAAYNASRAVEVKPPVEEKTPEFAYTSFGAPGTVLSRRELADLGVTQLVLSNNVRVNIKPTHFEANAIHVGVRFGGGTLCAPADKPGLAVLANSIFIGGGLGRHSADEIERIFAGKHVGAGFSAGSDAFSLSGGTTPADFALELRYLAAFLTDPGYRPEAERQARKAFEQLYPMLRHTDKGVFKDQVGRFLASGDFRFGFPKEQELAVRTVQEVRDWLAKPLAKEYLEVTIVGDIKVEEAVGELLKTFGALPARDKKLPTYKKERRIRFPDPAAAAKAFPCETTLHKAQSYVFWPTGTDRIRSASASRRLAVLADILGDRLREEIREKLGETYSPRAGASCSDTYTEYGYVIAAVGASPEQAQSIADISRRIGAEVAAKGVTDEEFGRAVKPLLNEIKESLRSNAFWMDAVSGSQQNPAQLDRARSLEKDAAAITIRDINKLARKHLKSENALQILILPANGPEKKAAARP